MPTVLVTGGAGSFGTAFTRSALEAGWTVRVFSRDEWKHGVLRRELGSESDIRYFVGDVRDGDRVRRAVDGCDLVVHAAALKVVESCEYNPFEAVRTNVLGSQNVVEACLDAKVTRAIMLSTDKAVHPVNLYGATKLCAEKCWLAANAYAGMSDIRFSAVRYGNVVGSRGSVTEMWRGKPHVELRDSRATRFWLNMDVAVDLVWKAYEAMWGGEVFVPKVSSGLVSDLVPAGANIIETELGRGEKIHEMLVSEEEVSRTWDCGDHYRICDYQPASGKWVGKDFSYTSGG